jgi:periplasmic divalent cation tolerance protein
MTETQHIVVQVAAGSADEAWAIARAVVERKVAACAQVFPARSCYEWEGKLTEADEHVVFVKSRLEAFDSLEACIKEHHSYDVPEIIALPIVAGSTPYLEWVDSVVAPEPR